MRYASIDILRTIGIAVMVLVHFSENLSGYTPRFTGLGAPVFALISGLSYFLWAHGLQVRGKSEEEIFKISVRRGLFVIGLGFVFNVLVWFPEDLFIWDVLTFIGSALLILNFARNIPRPVLIVAAILAIAISPPLRLIVDYHAYWPERYYEADLTLSDMLIGYLICGYFPIFPWISYSLVGFVTGSLMFGQKEEDRPSTERVLLFGGSLMAVAAAGIFGRSYLPAAAQKLVEGWTTFPATIPYVFGTIGMGLVLFGLAHRFVDLNPRAAKYTGLLDVAKTFSRYSLTIYVLHHIVHLWPMWITAAAQGLEPTIYWQHATTTPVAIGLAILFLTICYLVLKWIGPDERHGIEAWMRWLCD